MRKNSKIFFLIFVFCGYLFIPICPASQELPEWVDTQKTVSMDLQDASLKDVLKIFSIQSGLNFISSEAVKDRKITLYLDKVPIKKSMDMLFKANNLTYELDTESNIFIVKDWGPAKPETITKVFYLKYATVSSSSLKEEASNYVHSSTTTGTTTTTTSSSTGGTGEDKGKWGVEENSGITKAVKKLLTSQGVVVEDYRTNSLIVTDVPSNMPIITKTIAALDIPVPQVLLEVEMLDVSKNTIDKLGIKYGQTPFTMVLTGSSVRTSWPFVGSSLPLAAAKTLTPGTIGVNSTGYTILLDFLKTQSDTKSLARPRILTLNNETAEIKIMTREAIGRQSRVITVEGTAQSTEGIADREDTGVSLRVTPQINTETGDVTMFIFPSVKDTTTSTIATIAGGSEYFKDPEERSTKSTVRIKDGDTVIIGGLIRNDTSQTLTKLPILGDLPVVGALFRHKSRDKDRQRELLVFITPHIVNEAEPKTNMAKVKDTVSLPIREQGEVSVIDRHALISNSLNNFEKRVR